MQRCSKKTERSAKPATAPLTQQVTTCCGTWATQSEHSNGTKPTQQYRITPHLSLLLVHEVGVQDGHAGGQHGELHAVLLLQGRHQPRHAGVRVLDVDAVPLQRSRVQR
jgi:hypothetical protein